MISNSKSAHEVPFQKFDQWLKEAKKNSAIIEPTAMCLTTVNGQGSPSSRMILLKKYDDQGFCFFTNLTSRKGGELAENKNVALCFYWGLLGRQVRVEGKIEEVTKQEADDYFASRARGSQIGAWASKQSSEMQEWQEFQDRIDKFTQEFEGKEIARPPFWSGFRVVPTRIELWSEGEFRIHQREVYLKSEDSSGWEVKKIYP